MFSEFDLQIDNFMLYCDSKALTRKTKASYEQTLKLFAMYLQDVHNITDPSDVKSAHIRAYIKYLRERGKYTVISSSNGDNMHQNRTDFNKPISDTTIANYLRNIKVFFNFLHSEQEIKTNPAINIKNIKPKRKQKTLLKPDEIKRVLNYFDKTTFYGYRMWIMVRLMLDTGIRSGECCSLKPEHVDFKSKSILIENPKNHRQRYVFLSPKMRNDLKPMVHLS